MTYLIMRMILLHFLSTSQVNEFLLLCLSYLQFCNAIAIDCLYLVQTPIDLLQTFSSDSCLLVMYTREHDASIVLLSFSCTEQEQ